MNEATLRSPLVRRAIEAINQGHLDDFLALFAPDATVVDVSTYSGHEAIRAWAQRETFNVQVRFQAVREKNEEGPSWKGMCSPLVATLDLRRFLSQWMTNVFNDSLLNEGFS